MAAGGSSSASPPPMISVMAAGTSTPPNISVMAACGSISTSPPPWIELPIDVTENILRRLGPDEMLKTAEKVCTTWQSVCAEPSLWRVIHMKHPHKLLDTNEKRDQAGIVCRHAVDRSQGELIDININHFATDDLLLYISERSTRLKILTLENCWYVRVEGLITAVKNLPQLEELHLFCMMSIGAYDIENIGVACPMLKAFTFYCFDIKVSRLWMNIDWTQKIDNSDAFSIAKSMPNLARLCLAGNRLSNEGLLAILDGCRNLEWLDLRRCYNVHLEGDLGKRCSEHIKVLGDPYQLDDNRFYDPEDPHGENNYDHEDPHGENNYDHYDYQFYDPEDPHGENNYDDYDYDYDYDYSHGWEL